MRVPCGRTCGARNATTLGPQVQDARPDGIFGGHPSSEGRRLAPPFFVSPWIGSPLPADRPRGQWSRIFAAILGIPACAGCLAVSAGPAQVEGFVPDTFGQRPLACTGCHGREGRAGPDGYYRRITGKSRGCLLNQLHNFRDDRRSHRVMTALLANPSDEYLAEIAAHFASIELPYPPPAATPVPSAVRTRGESLVMHGNAARRIPPLSSATAARLPAWLPTSPDCRVCRATTSTRNWAPGSESGAGLHVATFLKTADQGAGPAHRSASGRLPMDADPIMQSGRSLYDEHCSDCHDSEGQGLPPGYPRLARNRAVMLDEPANIVRMVLDGGFPAATAGNPRPFGMPPFGHTLGDEEVAAVTGYLRPAWGNAAGAVSAAQVNRLRGIPLH